MSDLSTFFYACLKNDQFTLLKITINRFRDVNPSDVMAFMFNYKVFMIFGIKLYKLVGEGIFEIYLCRLRGDETAKRGASVVRKTFQVDGVV